MLILACMIFFAVFAYGSVFPKFAFAPTFISIANTGTYIQSNTHSATTCMVQRMSATCRCTRLQHNIWLARQLESILGLRLRLHEQNKPGFIQPCRILSLVYMASASWHRTVMNACSAHIFWLKTHPYITLYLAWQETGILGITSTVAAFYTLVSRMQSSLIYKCEIEVKIYKHKPGLAFCDCLHGKISRG